MKRFNSNYFAATVLLIAFAISTIRFLSVSAEIKRKPDAGGDAGSTITIAHWQLEPGFREGLDWAIQKYQELPHVKEAGIKVKQIPVSDKVYNQFMNVQLIAGTAPDLAQYGQTRLIQGSNTAKFYTALDGYVNDPNPYNAPRYLQGFLSPQQIESLQKTPWKNTFVDGMESTYDANLDGYYSIRISNLGQGRLFYNLDILTKVKDFVQEAMTAEPQPAWLQRMWVKSGANSNSGFIPEDDSLRQWLANDAVPQTLGQFMLYCEAIEAYAIERNRPYLVPISGSNYRPSDLTLTYRPTFLAQLRPRLDFDSEPGVSPLEAMDTLERGVWSLEDAPMKQYFEFAQIVSSYFPVGYKGLDREQAMRRFVLGDAAILSAGAWDVGPIVFGVQSRDNPEDVFELAISAPPLPVGEERWADILEKPITEMSQSMGGAGFALNKQSANSKWALDFLKFATSIQVNEEVNKRTGWLPSVVLAEPNEMLKNFKPIVEGYPQAWSFDPTSAKASIRASWTGLSELLVSGSISYDDFSTGFTDTLSDPRLGVFSFWFDEWQKRHDRSRSLDRSVSIEAFNSLFDRNTASAETTREAALFYQSISADEGIEILREWQNTHPGQEFPGK